MENLNEEKVKEEIKTVRVSRYTDLLKCIAVAFVPIVLFIAIQMPESLLNRKMSNESISRERAKLVFELIHNNNDYENILLELSVIEKAYPDSDNNWLKEIRKVYETRIERLNNAQIINSLDNENKSEIILLRIELEEQLIKKEMLQTQLVSEMSGENKNEQRAVAKKIETQIDEIEQEINNTRNSITETQKNNMRK